MGNIVKTLTPTVLGQGGRLALNMRGFVKFIPHTAVAIAVADELFSSEGEEMLPAELRAVLIAYGEVMVGTAIFSKLGKVYKMQSAPDITERMRGVGGETISKLKASNAGVKSWTVGAAVEALHHLPKLSNLGLKARASLTSLLKSYKVYHHKSEGRWSVYSRGAKDELLSFTVEDRSLRLGRDKKAIGAVLTGGTIYGLASIIGDNDLLSDEWAALLMTWADHFYEEAAPDAEKSSMFNLHHAEPLDVWRDPFYYVNAAIRNGLSSEDAQELVWRYIFKHRDEESRNYEELGLTDLAVSTYDAVVEGVTEFFTGEEIINNEEAAKTMSGETEPVQRDSDSNDTDKPGGFEFKFRSGSEQLGPIQNENTSRDMGVNGSILNT